jgi:hypothetical protein
LSPSRRRIRKASASEQRRRSEDRRLAAVRRPCVPDDACRRYPPASKRSSPVAAVAWVTAYEARRRALRSRDSRSTVLRNARAASSRGRFQLRPLPLGLSDLDYESSGCYPGSWRRDSNPLQSVPKTDALPNDLLRSRRRRFQNPYRGTRIGDCKLQAGARRRTDDAKTLLSNCLVNRRERRRRESNPRVTALQAGARPSSFSVAGLLVVRSSLPRRLTTDNRQRTTDNGQTSRSRRTVTKGARSDLNRHFPLHRRACRNHYTTNTTLRESAINDEVREIAC